MHTDLNNIAINGYGRIGRCLLRILLNRETSSKLKIVALNDLANLSSIEYLTRFDSTHGKFSGEIEVCNNGLCINSHYIKVFQSPTPDGINWEALELDLIMDCSGVYKTRAEGNLFLNAGGPAVLFSQPMRSDKDVDATIVYGFNHKTLKGHEKLISNASCTTNCGVPILNLLNNIFEIECVSITAIHSSMNDQPILDAYHHNDMGRQRAAFHSIIPVSTELVRGIERLLPSLTGLIQAKAMRVPTLNVSCLDMNILIKSRTNLDEVNKILSVASESEPLKDLLAYTEFPHASCDFNHDPHSAIIDASQTRISGGKLINILLWFDNEWAFANRMINVAEYYLSILKEKNLNKENRDLVL